MLKTSLKDRLVVVLSHALVVVLVVSVGATAQTAGGNLSSTATSGDTSSVSGQILNALTGAPLPRALVQINERAILTDHEGRFVFAALNSSGTTVNLRVTKPGYYGSPDGDAQFSTAVALDQQTAPLTLRLYPEALLTGTLTANDGTPLSRVMVNAQRSQYSEAGQQWIPVGQHQTNSRGEFRLTVPPGNYRIDTGYIPNLEGTSKAVVPSIYPAATSSETSSLIHLVNGTEQHLDLHADLSPTFSVPIRMDQTSDRAFPVLIARSSTGAIIPVGYERRSTEGGDHVQLPLGTYTLTATQNMGDTTEYGETNVTVSGPAAAPIVMHMSALPTIPVEVVLDTSSTSDKTPPLPQQLGLVLSPSHVSSARTPNAGMVPSRDRSVSFRPTPGTYRLMSMSNGQWFVQAATYGGVDLLQQDLVIAQGSGSASIRVTVSDQTGSLSGTVKLRGTPASAWVYLVPTGASSNSVYSTRSSPTGVFNFPYLPPGGYRAIAFEQRHPDDYRSPKRLDPYATYLQNASVSTGNKASLGLDAVPATELQP